MRQAQSRNIVIQGDARILYTGGKCERPNTRLTVIALFLGTAAWADAPVVEDVSAKKSGDVWHFSVTLSHADTGWDDYADGWRVELPDGTILGTRILHHPHVNEQPFTRSLGGVVIPAGTSQVMIRAKDNISDWANDTFPVLLPK